jgi:hypothetical protein
MVSSKSAYISGVQIGSSRSTALRENWMVLFVRADQALETQNHYSGDNNNPAYLFYLS